MKRLIVMVILIVLVSVFYSGLTATSKKSDYVLKVNDFVMTKDEFEDYFNEMNVSGEDSPKARKEVVDALISKKLILQEAEREGLDRDKEFLRSLERYYEQLLFRLIIDKKSKELGPKTQVSDKEVESLYNKLVVKGFTTEPLDEVYDQVKWQVFREKQTEAINIWLKELETKTHIEIDDSTVFGQ